MVDAIDSFAVHIAMGPLIAGWKQAGNRTLSISLSVRLVAFYNSAVGIVVLEAGGWKEVGPASTEIAVSGSTAQNVYRAKRDHTVI